MNEMKRFIKKPNMRITLGKVAQSTRGNPETTLTWPEEFKHIQVISIRPIRFEKFQERMNVWSQYSSLLSGTDGRKIKMREWKHKTAKCGHHQRDGVPRYIRRGELGCYDSHVRAWELMIEKGYPMMVIAEDDANLSYSPHTVRHLETCLKEIEEYDVKFDILYLGHRFSKVTKRLTPHLYSAWKLQTAYLYVLTLEGAKKLVRHCKPYRYPVDVFMYKAPNIKAVSYHPRVCGVSNAGSDTCRIK